MKKIIFSLIAIVSFTGMIFGQDIKKFNEDARIKQIVEIAYSFNDFTVRDFDKINKAQLSIDILCKEIIKDYGENNVINYINENLRLPGGNFAEIDGDGNKCKRNSNGTVNWDDCNFWETVSVVFGIVGCPEPYPGGGSSASQGELYYNCVQGVICKRC